MSEQAKTLDLRLLPLAADLQAGATGQRTLPDGTRVLELPAHFYYQRDRIISFGGEGTTGPPVPLVDVGYQFFDRQFQFVLRSIQYQTTGDYSLIFSNGRVLQLPPLATVMGTGATGRLDTSGTSSQDSAGGIVIAPCDRVTVTGQNFLNYSGGAVIASASILFIGVLRIFLRGGDVQPPYPAYKQEPRAIFSANQNIYAPESMRGWQCYPETPPGYRDEPFWVACPAVTVSVFGGNQTVNVVAGQVLLPGDADFIWREWDFVIVSADASITPVPVSPMVRFWTQNGESVSEDLVDCRACQGPVFPENPLPAGSFVRYEVSVQGVLGGSGDIVIQFYLYGVRRFRQ